VQNRTANLPKALQPSAAPDRPEQQQRHQGQGARAQPFQARAGVSGAGLPELENVDQAILVVVAYQVFFS
jgi:hypothetical protein